MYFYRYIFFTFFSIVTLVYMYDVLSIYHELLAETCNGTKIGKSVVLLWRSKKCL